MGYLLEFDNLIVNSLLVKILCCMYGILVLKNVLLINQNDLIWHNEQKKNNYKGSEIAKVELLVR